MESKRRCGVLTGKPAYTWLCEVPSNCAEGVDNSQQDGNSLVTRKSWCSGLELRMHAQL